MRLLRFGVWITVLATVAVLNGTGQERSRAHQSPDISYISWNGEKYSAKPDGAGFLIAPEGNWKKGFADNHIAYITWNGSKWEAKPEGKGFSIAPEGNWKKGFSSDYIDYLTWDRKQWRAWLQQDRTFQIEEH
jgi:hypothetical protein